eukprot:8569537-Ditylum_brightwellii.AAC.1
MWYEVVPKSNQYKRINSTKEVPKPFTYFTTCGTWCYNSMQGHFAKDHAQFKESSKKFPKRIQKSLGLGQPPRQPLQLQIMMLLTVRRVSQSQ